MFSLGAMGLTYFCMEVVYLLDGSIGADMHFKDAALESFWFDLLHGAPSWVPASLRKALYRKLQMLEAACCLNDLRVPPGNHLEKLKADRRDTYSVRVNSQWRLCFAWVQGEATEVELCDYHS